MTIFSQSEFQIEVDLGFAFQKELVIKAKF